MRTAAGGETAPPGALAPPAALIAGAQLLERDERPARLSPRPAARTGAVA